MMKVAKTVWLLPALLMILHSAPAATFVVTNASDNGAGSLHNAIEQANATPGTNFITFNIPGTNVHTVHLTTSLPAIARPVIINGYSQPGAASNTLAYGNNAQLRIELDGSMIADFHGLEILASHSTVRGLAVYGFPADAVLISGDAASNNVVAGNFIGADATGTNLIGNLYSGVHLEFGASGNRIGGELPGDRNRIAGNSGSGVSLLDPETIGNAILGNEVFANGDLGIDLGYDGVTTNDSNDADGGPNGLQNFPTITYVESDSGLIQGTLTSAPATAYRIEFFASDTRDASGFGQGQTFLGVTNLNTDGAGTVNFSFTTPHFIPPDAYVTGTATDPFGNTSEFSQARATVPEPPALKILIDGVLVTNNALAVTNIADAEFRSTFSTSGIFYTVDGSDPRFGARYTGTLTLTQSVTLRAIAAGADGVTSAERDPVAVTVLRRPVIQIQPASQTVAAGATVQLVVTADGDAPLGYQWRFNGVAIGGASSAVLDLGSVQTNYTGGYSVVVTNPSGSVTSSVAHLTVVAPPAITGQPAGATVQRGDQVIFCVSASGASLRYQWRLNGVNIPGATNACHTNLSVTLLDAGSYTVVVANDAAAITSEPALLAINLPIVAPGDYFTNRTLIGDFTNAIRGANTGFTNEADETFHAGKPGGRSAWYSWHAPAGGIAYFSTAGSSFDTLLAIYIGTNLTQLTEVASDEDSGGFLTSAVRFNASAGMDYAIAIDGFAGAEGDFVLSWYLEPTVQTLPEIVTQPRSETVASGESVTFSISANAPGGIAYQWFFNGALIPGATAGSYTITNVQIDNVGYYHIHLSTVNGRQMDSAIAVLEIGPDPRAQSHDKVEDFFAAPSGGGLRFVSAVSVDNGIISVPLGDWKNQIVDNSTNSSTSSTEPNSCAQIVNATRWLALKPLTNATLAVTTEGSLIPTVAAVYGFGASSADFIQLDCAVDAPNEPRERMRIPVVSNHVYYIVADGYGGAKGKIQFNWALGSRPPTNCAAPLQSALSRGDSMTLDALDACGLKATPLPQIFQWLHNQQPLAGQTKRTLAITNYQPGMEGLYSVQAGNLIGFVSNVIAILPPIPGLPHLASVNRIGGTNYLRVEGAPGAPFLIRGSTTSTDWANLLSTYLAYGTNVFFFQDSPGLLCSNRQYQVWPALQLSAAPLRDSVAVISVRLSVPARLERSYDLSHWEKVLALSDINTLRVITYDQTNIAPTNLFFRLKP